MNASLRKTSFAIAAIAALATAITANAESYYWNGGNSGTWNATNTNWTNATGTATAWVDGNDAVFDASAAKNLPVKGAVHADNILVSKGTQQVLFGDVGTLSWQGWAQHQPGGSFSFSCPLADNGNGLHFDVRGNTFLRRENTHTGGTFIKNSKSGDSMRAFAINGATKAADNPTGNDLALGPVPDTVQTNLTIKGGNVALFVDSSFTNTIHKNRTIFIEDNQTFFVSPAGRIDIMGSINGANAGLTAYPTATRLHAYGSGSWHGLTVLHGTNYFGKLQVSGRLEIADGQTTLITSGSGTETAAALYVVGDNSAYNAQRGYLLVSGGRLVNHQNSYRFQTSGYGHLDIAGGYVGMAFNTTKAEYGEFLNGLSSPGKVTIRDGGMLSCSRFRLTQANAGNGGELFLEEGGTLRVRWIGVDFKIASNKGIVHFNGGALQSHQGNVETNVVENATHENWAGKVFQIEEGGAIFDTLNGQNIWFGRPLISGVTGGGIDGGLTCKLGSGRAVVFDQVANHTYTGPTRVERIGNSGTGTLQCRIANALPATTTLQVGTGCQAGFNLWAGAAGSAEREAGDLAQTVARVEGTGTLIYNSHLTVTGGVKPAYTNVYGTLTFTKYGTTFSNATYDVVADGEGCGCIKFNAGGQDISGLTLNIDASVLDKDTAHNYGYKILDAPNGFTGEFQAGNVTDPWYVEYTSTAAYLRYRSPFVITVR